MMNDRIVWHYTTGQKFELIVGDGYLQVSTTSALPHEKAILWFSAEPYWEPTANKAMKEYGKMRVLSMEETYQMGRGLVRFGIDRSKLHQWPKIGRKAGISKQQVSAMETVGRAQGSHPDNWYGTTQPIDLSRIEEISVMDEHGAWVTVRKGEAPVRGSTA